MHFAFVSDSPRRYVFVVVVVDACPNQYYSYHHLHHAHHRRHRKYICQFFQQCACFSYDFGDFDLLDQQPEYCEYIFV